MSQKDVKIGIALAVGIIGVSVLGYVLNTEVPSESVPTVMEESPKEGWMRVDVQDFSMALPPGWKYSPLQGIDSLVGEFTGAGVTLNFDYGWYSNSLVNDADPAYVVTYETIDGANAKIVVPRAVTNGTTGVYFEGLGTNRLDRLQISGTGLTDAQQDLVLQMFRTIQFAE